MRIAVFADIHGNRYALEAVLNAIAQDGAFDAVVAAGDICSGGSSPVECVDLLRNNNIRAVYGNADVFIFDAPEHPPAELYRERWNTTYKRARWAERTLGNDRVNWLRNLPFDLRFSPTSRSSDDLLIVHANPKEPYTHILPPENIQIELFGEVDQPDNNPELNGLFTGIHAGIMAYGHLHYSSQRVVRGIRLVNVSPCSFSHFVETVNTRYTVFTWKKTWIAEQKFVDYDIQLEKDALTKCDIPQR